MSKWYGKGKARQSWYIVALVWQWVSVICVDVFRHRQVMQGADEVLLVAVNFTNPFASLFLSEASVGRVANNSNSSNGSSVPSTTDGLLSFTYSLNQLADSTFASAVVMFLENCIQILFCRHGTETVTISTRYRILQKEEVEQEAREHNEGEEKMREGGGGGAGGLNDLHVFMY